MLPIPPSVVNQQPEESFSTRQPSALLRSTIVLLLGGAVTLAAVLVPDVLLDRQAQERFGVASKQAASPVIDSATAQFRQLEQLALGSANGAQNEAFQTVLGGDSWQQGSLFNDIAYVEYLSEQAMTGGGMQAMMEGDTTTVEASTEAESLLLVRSFSSSGSQNMQVGPATEQFLSDIGIAGRPPATEETRLVWAPAATMIRAGIIPPTPVEANAELAPEAAPANTTESSPLPDSSESPINDALIDNGASFVEPDQASQATPQATQATPQGEIRSQEVQDPAFESAARDVSAEQATGRTIIAAAIPVPGRGWIIATIVPVDDAENGLARIVEIGDLNAKKTIGGLGIEETSRRTRTEQFSASLGPLTLDVAVLGPWRFRTPQDTHPVRNGLVLGGSTLLIATGLGMRRHRRNVAALTAMVTHARKQARVDSLTGLANRVGILDALTEASADDGVAVLLADLDRFKNVNDSRGHASGDLLLQAVADRFRSLGDANPFVRCIARFGGDEFVVVLVGPENEIAAGAVTFADAILGQLRTPFPLGGDTVVIGASIGLAVGSGADTTSLVSDADIAMYAAKRGGGSRVAVADDELRRAGSGQLDLEIGIRNALATGEFVPYFQPIVDEDGHLHSFEALIRWRRSDGTLMSPGAFLPAAQIAGLLGEVSTSVLASVCPYVATWNTQRISRGMTPLTVHVNCVEQQLMDMGFPDVVSSLLTHHGVDPSWIMLEVSEETALDKIASGTPTLHSLRSMGVRFSLDDFGFGNSSLTMLRELGDVAELKLDKSIVDDIAIAGIGGDADVVDAILGFARKRNITIVAEGVEQDNQWQALKALGVQLYQGFLFSRPLPPEDAALWAAGERQAEVLWRPDGALADPQFASFSDLSSPAP